MLIEQWTEKSKSLFLEFQNVGAASLKNDLRNFTDGLIFPFEETGKNMLIYNDMQESFILEDYQGNKEEIRQKTGACIVPATYELGKSIDYTNFISEESSSRSIYKE